MNILDKKHIINDKCTEHCTTHKKGCTGCPLMEYFTTHGYRNCVEVPLDVQYELMTKGGN